MGPKCGFCQGTSFKLDAPFSGIQGANYKMQFVVCSKCNAAVAVLSYFDPGMVAKDVEDKVDALKGQVASMKSDLQAIKSNVAALMSEIKRMK